MKWRSVFTAGLLSIVALSPLASVQAQQYGILFQTADGHDDGTSSDVHLQMYDVNGALIGGSFEVTETLHDNWGSALQHDSVQYGTYTVPGLRPQDVAAPVFLTVTINGSDKWMCSKIWIGMVDDSLNHNQYSTPMKSYGNLEWAYLLAGDKLPKFGYRNVFETSKYAGTPTFYFNCYSEFTFNTMFSTDNSEGVPSKQMPMDSYKLKVIGQTASSTGFTNTWSLQNNSHSNNPLPVDVSVTKVSGKTVSLANSDDESKRSIDRNRRNGQLFDGRIWRLGEQQL